MDLPRAGWKRHGFRCLEKAEGVSCQTESCDQQWERDILSVTRGEARHRRQWGWGECACQAADGKDAGVGQADMPLTGAHMGPWKALT